MNDLICQKHQVSLECMGGRSAHRSNWYCPTCHEEKTKPDSQLIQEREAFADTDLIALLKEKYNTPINGEDCITFHHMLLAINTIREYDEHNSK